MIMRIHPAVFLASLTALEQDPTVFYVPFNSVPAHLYPHWKALGDRIEKAASERIIAIGLVTKRTAPTSGLAVAQPVRSAEGHNEMKRKRLDGTSSGWPRVRRGLTTAAALFHVPNGFSGAWSESQ